MKVCVSSNGNSVESAMDPRFGRAAYFVIADIDTKAANIEIYRGESISVIISVKESNCN